MSLLSGRFEDETHIGIDDEPLFTGQHETAAHLSQRRTPRWSKRHPSLYRKEAFLTLGLTYDMSVWFFQNQSLSFFNAARCIQTPVQQANLTLQGITLTTRLDF